jgi:hypothetical protein
METTMLTSKPLGLATLHTATHPALHLETPGRGRLLLATLLHGAGLALGQLARQLLPASPAPATHEPQLEFHAQAGAPEGALYVDGKLVGHLHGVQRL